MRRTLALPLVLGLAILAPPAHATNFGELFPNLPDFTAPTNQQLADLAQTQLDPNLDADNNCAEGPGTPNASCTFAGYTYFGQFIDHDLTLDTLPSPTAPVDVSTLTNGRTFRLDLDSVYGGGPGQSPQLYAADRAHLLVQNPNAGGARDLPRNPDGSAILVEPRNDENEIISQIQTAFLLAHNRLVDEGMNLNQARRTMIDNYQWAVVHDFLPHILIAGMADNNLAGARQSPLFAQETRGREFVPSEFSVAAYRFGHSQVRRAYFLNDALNAKVQVFRLDGGDDLHGGRELPVAHGIEWKYFFPEQIGDEGPTDPDNNIGRRIDPLISSSLFQLPIPGAEASGSNVLAFRNLVRAKFYGVPSGQDVATALGIAPITPAELNLGPGFETGTPLWYYILAESSRTTGGRTLGPVGSAIVGATFASLLTRDGQSVLNRPAFTPNAELAGADGQMTISDFFSFAGVEEPSGLVLP